jgi:hypothetical protein
MAENGLEVPDLPPEGKAQQRAAQAADALALLRADRGRIAAMLERARAKSARNDNTAGEIPRELRAHIIMKQRAFYPALEQAGVNPKALEQAGADAAKWVAEIDALDTPSADAQQRSERLIESCLRALHEEERLLFPEARAKLGARLIDLAVEMEARKSEASGAGGVG